MLKRIILLTALLLGCGSKSPPANDLQDDAKSTPDTVAVDQGLKPLNDSGPTDHKQSVDHKQASDQGKSLDQIEGFDPGTVDFDTYFAEPDWGWTWLDCHRAFLDNTLSEEDQALCTNYYTTPPTKLRFGLYWIFLGHDEAFAAAYPYSQLEDLNEIYAPNDMEFFVHSIQRIVDPVATTGANDNTKFPISTLIPEMRQFLETDEEDPQAVLDLFLNQLEANGAEIGKPADSLDGPGLGSTPVTLESEWEARDLHGRVARLNNAYITIVVRQATGDKSWGFYPQSGFSNPSAGLIYLSTAPALSALPHEVGHYFGLPHTHGPWSKRPGSTQPWQTSLINSFDDGDWAQLETMAGEDYDGNFEDSYLSFDSPVEVLTGFEDGQLLARKVLAWADLTYVDDFLPVPSDADFIALIRAGTPPYMKNFVREDEGGSFSGNNCGKDFSSDDATTLRCKYGDDEDEPLHILYGDHPSLLDSVLFGESTESNMMSYITTDISDGQRRKKHLTQRQRDVIRLGTRVPSRLRLRNYALFD